jgi:ribosomal protein L11 methyltransferase
MEGEAREIELDLTPDDLSLGIVFGTGTHPTTRLALELLEDRVRDGDRVLDIGTGSGILAIAAARLGAREVVAVDTDPAAAAVARGNVASNELTGVVQVREGSIEAAERKPHDLVVANILAPVLERLAPGVARLLRPGGLWIVSGVIASRAAAVITTIGATGFRMEEERAEGDWRGLCFTRCDANERDYQSATLPSASW